MTVPAFGLPVFRAPFAPPDEELAAELPCRPRPATRRRKPDRRARARWSRRSAPRPAASAASRIFCTPIRLSTKEGLALMVLAEALLRVPDAATATG
jgi:RHH-type proline utilization regulon transcriptional repressor/proline dehydrogenase/delta 1-pyrroline-5-carboxylate dehydrogenase